MMAEQLIPFTLKNDIRVLRPITCNANSFEVLHMTPERLDEAEAGSKTLPEAHPLTKLYSDWLLPLPSSMLKQGRCPLTQRDWSEIALYGIQVF